MPDNPPVPDYDVGLAVEPDYDIGRPGQPDYDTGLPGEPDYDMGPPGHPDYDMGRPGQPDYDVGLPGEPDYDMGPPGHPDYDMGRPGQPDYDTGLPGEPDYDMGPPGHPDYDMGQQGQPDYDMGLPGEPDYDMGRPGQPDYDMGLPGEPDYDMGPPGHPDYDMGRPGQPDYDMGLPGEPDYDSASSGEGGYSSRGERPRAGSWSKDQSRGQPDGMYPEDRHERTNGGHSSGVKPSADFDQIPPTAGGTVPEVLIVEAASGRGHDNLAYEDLDREDTNSHQPPSKSFQPDDTPGEEMELSFAAREIPLDVPKSAGVGEVAGRLTLQGQLRSVPQHEGLRVRQRQRMSDREVSQQVNQMIRDLHRYVVPNTKCICLWAAICYYLITAFL